MLTASPADASTAATNQATSPAAPDFTVTPRADLQSRFVIAGDRIVAATAELPERQREALRWLAGYARTKNLHHRELGRLLTKPGGEEYSSDSVLHSLTGRRTSQQLENIVGAIERFRAIEEAQAAVLRPAFIENSLSRRIWAVCQKALKRRRMISIWGNSQTGKTWSLEEYAVKHNHGETHYMRCSVRMKFKDFLVLLCASLGQPIGGTVETLRERVFAAVDGHMLLIVDELHLAFGVTGNNPLGADIVEFMREVHDRKKCGTVLCGTPTLKRIFTDGIYAGVLVQTTKRSLPPLRLPDCLGDADLALFATYYRLSPAPDKEVAVNVTYTDDAGCAKVGKIQQNVLSLQRAVNATEGLGRWVTILEEASEIAKERRRPLTWGIVLHAWHSFEQASKFEASSEEAAS